ncbi:hypothetical protein ADUPG1_000070, partial [Aduncisulcus paluster]
MCFFNFPILSIEGLLVQSSILEADAVIQTVEPEFVHEGEYDCSPIPRDAPNIKSAELPTIKAIDRTEEEGKYGYDQSYYAQKMMKGEWNDGQYTHISIPFSSTSPMKGAYICLRGGSSNPTPPSHLIFTFISSKGEKTSKKYRFPEFEGFHWYFLPVDLLDVVLCEITGKGRYSKYFRIVSLVFISREETPEEIKSREAREKLWSEAPVVKPEFVKEGDEESYGRDSIPIARDDPKLVDPSFSMVKCKNDSVSMESKYYDRSSDAQKMLKGEDEEDCVELSHLSIPFTPNPMKGAYVCVNKYASSPSLLFTFTDCDGKKTSKKYEFKKLKHKYEWHFLPIDLCNVVLCEIEGKGSWYNKKCRDFDIESLIFLRDDDIPTSHPLLTPVPVPSSSSKTPTSTLSLPSKPLKEEEDFIQMSSSTDAVIQTVEPEFVHEGNEACCPIPRDAPNIKSVTDPTIEAIDGTKEEGDEKYDQSFNAQEMMKENIFFGKLNFGYFTHISIPFSSSSPMKGAYICLYSYSSAPSQLIFTFTSSKSEKTSKKYEFPEFYGWHWYFLPVDLLDVVLCEITGKGREKEYFRILSLIFISREETPEELKSREAKQKLWFEAPVVKPEFVKKGYRASFGRDSIPIPRDDPKLVDPSFSMVKCKLDAFSKESVCYDQSSDAQKMLKGEDPVLLSHLSIPFPSPSPMKGAYICVDHSWSSPSLLFTFTDNYGKKTCKKYEFTRLKHEYEWHFLPIDLDNVVLCEIEGKGRWDEKNSRWFWIYSLVFLRGDDIPTSPPLLTPVPVPFTVQKEAVKEAVKEEEEEKTESWGKKDIPSSSKQQTESLTQETKTSEPTKSNPNQPTSSTPSQQPISVPLPQTLTSSCTITPLCIIGKGGFGVVILARVEYPASYCSPPVLCALKCMKNKESCEYNEKCVKDMKKEFSRQHRLYFKSSLQSCIPRPLHILDLLDGDLK